MSQFFYNQFTKLTDFQNSSTDGFGFLLKSVWPGDFKFPILVCTAKDFVDQALYELEGAWNWVWMRNLNQFDNKESITPFILCHT